MAEAEVANINTVVQVGFTASARICGRLQGAVVQVLRDSLQQLQDRNNQLEAALEESQREVDSLQDQLQQSESVVSSASV